MVVRDSNSRAFSDLPDDEIVRLVESLNSLHEGELGIPMLVACGKRAIGFLRQFLFNGKPSSLPQPRERAVRALAELGAKDVLLEYLGQQRTVPDLAIALGEEAVQNTAARLLGAWRTEDVFHQLLHFVERKPIAGVIETLGEFARPEAVPFFISALGDDVCRRPAEDALRKAGRQAITALIEAVRTPEPSRNFESPSSLRRRQSALRILQDAGVSREQWPQLEFLLYETEPAFAIPAAGLIFGIAPEHQLTVAFRLIVQALPQCDWYLEVEAENALLAHFHRLASLVASEIEARQRTEGAVNTYDKVVRLLRAVEKQASKMGCCKCA
jgi:hypothetical protein